MTAHTAEAAPQPHHDSLYGDGYVLRCTCGEGFMGKSADEAIFMWQVHATRQSAEKDDAHG